MSLFLPSHKKTYIDLSPHKLKKKKKKKRKKIPTKAVEKIYESQKLENLKKLSDSPTESPKNLEYPIVPPCQGDPLSIEPSLPMAPTPLLPELSTYYDHLHMFAQGTSHSPKVQMVGQKAKLDFLDSYKYLNSPKNNRYSESKSTSPVIRYLHKIDEKKLTPIPMGVFKRKGNIREVDISMYSIGNRYAEALSEGIHMLSPVKLQINDNRLSEEGIETIITSLNPEELIDLNISNNKVSPDNLILLSKFVSSRQSVLKILKLEGLNLRDSGCSVICKALKRSKTILELDLAKNSIEGNKTLNSFILQTNTLQKLDLHWNLVRAQGALGLCGALMKNTTLKVLDLSWNSLNTLAKLDSMQVLAEVLERHPALVHVDISNNSLTSGHIELLSKGLEKNHTILGIHMSGNHGQVNELGFLSAELEDRPGSAINFRRIMGFSRINTQLTWRAVSNCWICERWSLVTFEWTGEKQDPVYLHLSFDDFDGDLLSPPDYKVSRMCPPGHFQYFFTVNGRPETTNRPAEAVNRIEKEFELSQNKKVKVVVSQVNVVHANPKGPDLLSVLNDKTPLPRIPLRKFRPKVVEKQWSVAESIFKDYKLDSPELLGKCFDYDWGKCKVPRLIKDLNELEKIKTIIASRYQVIKEIYKYYSSIAPAGEIWSIGQMVFTDICNESKIIDNTFRLSDIDFHLKGALFQEVRNPRSPPNSLVRFQFMEILVRIALDKYFKSGICAYQSEAVSCLLDRHILANLGHVSAQKWRDDRYFYMSVETSLKSNMSLLQYIYSCFSKRKVKPGQKPFMCLDEFSEIILKSNLLNDNFTAREIAIAFNLSMMTQVQELDTDRQYQMSFIEFLEAISRVSDMINNSSGSLSSNLDSTLPKLIPLLPYSLQRDLSKQSS